MKAESFPSENGKGFSGPKLVFIFSLLAVVVIIPLVFYGFFAAPQKEAEREVFVTSFSLSGEDLVRRLEEEGFIRNAWAFGLVLRIKGVEEVEPGGYRISKNMNAWELAGVFGAEPDLVWVTIPEGWRKEQIGERLAKSLGWDHNQLSDWIQKYTALDFDHLEGVYFPDTYLIPKDEDGLSIANRFRNRFEKKLPLIMRNFLPKILSGPPG